MVKAKEPILQVAEEFGNKFGRKYDLIEGYKLEDAERVIIALGSTCGTARVVVDELREKGEKVGLLKIRVFRPFPADEIAKALSKIKTIAMLDRVDSLSGQGSPIYTEVKAALFNLPNKPNLVNYVYGLGGRDINTTDLAAVFEQLKTVEKLPEKNYIGVRE